MLEVAVLNLRARSVPARRFMARFQKDSRPRGPCWARAPGGFPFGSGRRSHLCCSNQEECKGNTWLLEPPQVRKFLLVSHAGRGIPFGTAGVRGRLMQPVAKVAAGPIPCASPTPERLVPVPGQQLPEPSATRVRRQRKWFGHHAQLRQQQLPGYDQREPPHHGKPLNRVRRRVVLLRIKYIF